MPAISITRLELRGLRFLPSFFLHTTRSGRQVVAAPGYLGGGTGFESLRAYWTVTAWQDAGAMKAFRNDGAHLAAMRRLIDICCAASYGHWEQPSAAIPSLDEVHRRMLAEGKLSKVRHPSKAHSDGKPALERVPKGYRHMKPRPAIAA